MTNIVNISNLSDKNKNRVYTFINDLSDDSKRNYSNKTAEVENGSIIFDIDNINDIQILKKYPQITGCYKFRLPDGRIF